MYLLPRVPQGISPRRSRDSLTPSPPSECAPPPPEPQGAGILACEWGGAWVSPDSNDWRKSLALCVLCGYHWKIQDLAGFNSHVSMTTPLVSLALSLIMVTKGFPQKLLNSQIYQRNRNNLVQRIKWFIRDHQSKISWNCPCKITEKCKIFI